MLSSYAYSSAWGGADMLVTSAEILSLAYILASFIILAYLALRAKSTRSFQFEMFLFVMVLASAELPAVLYHLSGLDLGIIVTYGLEVHSLSMFILAGFVAYRIYGFFKGKEFAGK